MHNYRSMMRNTNDDLFKTRTMNGNLSATYRDVYNLLFINGKVDYNYTWKNLLYGYNYQGIMSEKTTLLQPGKQQNVAMNINMSKGFNFWSTTIRFSGRYSNTKGKQLIQEQLVDYRTQGYEFSTYLHLIPNRFVDASNSFIFEKNKSRISDSSHYFSSIKNIANIIRLNVHLTNALTINWNVELQYNNLTSKRHTSFADAGIKYKYKEIELEFELNNIFNSKKYISAFSSHTYTHFYSYNLRPMSAFVKVRFKLK